jgi:hypothetical protein
MNGVAGKWLINYQGRSKEYIPAQKALPYQNRRGSE